MFVSRILVIGAGGTGSYLIPPLARLMKTYSDGSELIIADGDYYTESNIERQEFPASKIGVNKAEVAAMSVSVRLPSFANNIKFIPEFLSAERIKQIAGENAIIITCVDNDACRLYAEQAVSEMPYGAHVCPGNEMWTGQVRASVRYAHEWVTPSLLTERPDWLTAKDDRSEMDCHTLANLPSGGQIVMANFTAAAITLNMVGQILSLPNADHRPAATYVGFDVSNNSFLRKGVKKIELV